jgi:hypothetical protein
VVPHHCALGNPLEDNAVVLSSTVKISIKNAAAGGCVGTEGQRNHWLADRKSKVGLSGKNEGQDVWFKICNLVKRW